MGELFGRVGPRALAARDYPSVDELYSRAGAANSQICPATLYRTLRLLSEFGRVKRYTFRGGVDGERKDFENQISSVDQQSD